MAEDWDVRKRQDAGDAAPHAIFHAVGAALSLWETLESELAELFDRMIYSGNRAGFKIFTSVGSVSARIQLMEAALPMDNADIELT